MSASHWTYLNSQCKCFSSTQQMVCVIDASGFERHQWEPQIGVSEGMEFSHVLCRLCFTGLLCYGWGHSVLPTLSARCLT